MELRIIDYIAGVAFIVVALSATALSLWEVQEARADPETYSQVYRMSADEYVAKRYRTAGLSAIALVLPVLLFADPKRRRVWRAVVLASCALWIAWIATVIVRYWEWTQVGFDH